MLVTERLKFGCKLGWSIVSFALSGTISHHCDSRPGVWGDEGIANSTHHFHINLFGIEEEWGGGWWWFLANRVVYMQFFVWNITLYTTMTFLSNFHLLASCYLSSYYLPPFAVSFSIFHCTNSNFLLACSCRYLAFPYWSGSYTCSIIWSWAM